MPFKDQSEFLTQAQNLARRDGANIIFVHDLVEGELMTTYLAHGPTTTRGQSTLVFDAYRE